MKSAEIRSSFLDHFERHGHRKVASAPLVPLNDPSILFTVAGMVQFKEALTGRETLSYSRAVTCQRCVRAGGKHNDLENVGFTARHHTFFEMLGNFSFGDYFKEEAITWGWEFFHDILSLDQEKLWITVHPSDDVARELWIKHIGIHPDRVVDHEENFWTMGDTGPCGPCSEIFFDQGPSVEGGPPGSINEDGDRFLEIGNLVFPQFDRSEGGELAPLASPGVDTGLGLERLASVMQGVHSNYETDGFRQIFEVLTSITGMKDVQSSIANPSCRVIADHIRCSAFLIADGVLPDREGRNYVLRRIIRRALRHAHKLGIEKVFFSELVNPLIENMGSAYPMLGEQKKRIKSQLTLEESKFKETLDRGIDLLEGAFKKLTSQTLSGEIAFKLYDTYGFPLDLTVDIARERGVDVDVALFDRLMLEQQQRAREAGQFKLGLGEGLNLDTKVDFLGYSELNGKGEVLNLYLQSEGSLIEVEKLESGQDGVVVLSQSTFYGEAGGQVGDIGLITGENTSFSVRNVVRSNEQFLHFGSVETGELIKGQSVEYEVDRQHRQDVARNHSATHLLHAALRDTLGDHVHQRGSLVEASKLRFDFSNDSALTPEQLDTVESKVNELILLNSNVSTQILPYDEAIEKGAVALFGEKYGDEVRVLDMAGGYSVELCGGTHVKGLGEIGVFSILSESSSAAGIRRIEAVTGRVAYQKFRELVGLIDDLAKSVAAPVSQLKERVEQINEERLQLRHSASHQAVSPVSLIDSVWKESSQISETELLTSVVNASADLLLPCYDILKERWPSHVVVLASIEEDRCQLVAGVSNSLTDQITSNEVLKVLGETADIRGGGRPNLARGGGQASAEELEQAFDRLHEWVLSQLSS